MLTEMEKTHGSTRKRSLSLLKQKVLLLPSSLGYPSCLMEQDPISIMLILHWVHYMTLRNPHVVTHITYPKPLKLSQLFGNASGTETPSQTNCIDYAQMTSQNPRGQPMSDDWRLTVEEVQKIAAKNHGATGPDGWSVKKSIVGPKQLGVYCLIFGSTGQQPTRTQRFGDTADK